MRKRFESQLIIGQKPINETIIPVKTRDSLAALLAALKEIFVNDYWNQKVFEILENKILSGKKETGRNGMNLWQIFVLAQVRLCLNISYDRLHMMANYDTLMRQIMGVETEYGYEKVQYEYQNILDNVSLLDDETVRELNRIILEFGHEVFKKKEAQPLRLKTDSFVVESNVHFPTDYNLLWDCARKSLDMVTKFLEKYPHIPGWRKIKNWYREMKSIMRLVGKVSSSGGKGKEERLVEVARKYLTKAKALILKLESTYHQLPVIDKSDIAIHLELERFIILLSIHIDLVARRLIKKEKIPHQEKIFSIFEQYTEWVTKGKLHPNVELGKKVAVTTDHYGLIVDYMIMENQSDSEIVHKIYERLIKLFTIKSWSFDKGFWHKDNKELLKTNIA